MILAMYTCVLLGILCYPLGFITPLLIAMCSVFLAYIGYRLTGKVLDI